MSAGNLRFYFLLPTQVSDVHCALESIKDYYRVKEF